MQINYVDDDPFPNPDSFNNPPTPGKPETPEQNYIHTVSNSLLWAGAIDLTLAIILAYFLSSFLLRKIYRLKNSMHQYMADGSSKPVSHGEDDEVDDLANIYNLLIEKIDKEEKIRKEFFIDMSHELRTPLTSVKGYLEGLVDHVFDPDKEKDIHEKTLAETDRMIHLVKEMTTLAKLESEKIKLVTKPTNLRLITDEVTDMLSPQIKKQHLKTAVHGDVETTIDPYKFKQVIINLVDNAIHYAKKNSTINIEMGKEKTAPYWRIKNSTEGVNPQEVENFFERFYRGDKSRSYDATKPHLGIGLNIVKKIVEQHGGKITAKLEGDEIVFEIRLVA